MNEGHRVKRASIHGNLGTVTRMVKSADLPALSAARGLVAAPTDAIT
jgi:hypothetical protein